MDLLKKENLSEDEKINREVFLSKINFGFDILTKLEFRGYKLQSLNLKDGCVIFSNGTKEEKYTITQLMDLLLSIKNKANDSNVQETFETSETSETSEMPNLTETEMIVKQVRNEPVNKLGISETSKMTGGYENINFSETSEMYEISEMSDMSNISKNLIGGNNKIMGGSKNIFYKSKYSETSSLNQSNKSTNLSNYSATSSVIFNGRSDKYSDTSVLVNQVNQVNQIKQMGGANMNKNQMSLTSNTANTLSDVSELKQRKVSKNSSSNVKLDMGIFTKAQAQTGGSVDSFKKKMMNMGINSNSSNTSNTSNTSTSSICE